MTLSSVSECLLTKNNINRQCIDDVLTDLMQRRLDYGDLFFQSSYVESWVLEDGLIKEGAYCTDQGVGIRAVHGDKTGFAYANQIIPDTIKQSAVIARTIVAQSGNGKFNTLKPIDYQSCYASNSPLSEMSYEEKISILRRVDEIARKVDPRVQEVSATLMGQYQQILIASTDGTLVADIRPLVRLSVSVQLEDRGMRERGNSGGGGRFSYHYFLDNVGEEIRVDTFTREAVRIAQVNLAAVSAPAGNMPVILGSGWPGILLHEAVGHGLEGDFNRKGTSIFSGQLGQKVASRLCTVVDDGTLLGRRGSLSVDDEGVPSQYNVLIEDGILKNYMQDKLNARLMGMKPTGNARRESYAYIPMPRMTNTYMLPGKSTLQEMVASVDYGLYACNFSGGQVDITSGTFVFSTSEAYLIKKGKITESLKGATLIGSGIEVMRSISMVGNDLDLDQGVGICSKEGQNIPVSVGQPTLKIDGITVGGTA